MNQFCVQRIKILINTLKDNQLDAVLIVGDTNRFYLSNFISSNANLLISRQAQICFTDARYAGRARKELGDFFEVREFNKDFPDKLSAELQQQKIKTLGIEYNFYTLHKFQNLKSTCRGIKFADISQDLSFGRQIKDASEIKAISKAAQIGDRAFAYIFDYIKKNYKKGLSESMIAWQLEKFMREVGAEAVSFAPIVASGSNSSFPHHESGKRKLGVGDNIILDFGCKVSGYCSDMTRTIFIGRPSEQMIVAYNTVIEAQAAALGQVKAGQKSQAIDQAAREVIDQSVYTERFIHACGHGVGLDIHELPSLHQNNQTEILRAGMTVTVEPGIYVDNKFGIRIEDLVVIERDGYKSLNKSDKVLNRMIIV